MLQFVLLLLFFFTLTPAILTNSYYSPRTYELAMKMQKFLCEVLIAITLASIGLVASSESCSAGEEMVTRYFVQK